MDLYKEKVSKHYSQEGIREWRRLFRNPYHRLEFDTTVHFLNRHLPKNGLILDAGGGPGRYTIQLAKRGYDMVLLDLSPKLLEIAEHNIDKAHMKRRVKEVLEGSIDDLSVFNDESFDATICLGGPLCHILDPRHREKAINELLRVTKKGSPLFISVIGRTAVIVTILIESVEELEIPDFISRFYDDGDYDGSHGFTACHFYTPNELEDSMRRRDAEVLELVGLEGLASGHFKETNRLYRKHPEAWKNWWKLHLETCSDPVVVGMSEHFMIVCRK